MVPQNKVSNTSVILGGGVRANIFRYHLQKMEVVFLIGEIAVVRHLVDANPHVKKLYIPLETKAPLKGMLPGNVFQNDYNLENEHKTFNAFIIRNDL